MEPTASLMMPKELQSYNTPGLKADDVAAGTRRERRQREVYGDPDQAVTPSSSERRRKKSNNKKKKRGGGAEKKKRKTDDDFGTPQTPLQGPPPAAGVPTAALDFLRLFQQGGAGPQAPFPAAPAQAPQGQQFVFNNFNVYICPEPKK